MRMLHSAADEGVGKCGAASGTFGGDAVQHMCSLVQALEVRRTGRAVRFDIGYHPVMQPGVSSAAATDHRPYVAEPHVGPLERQGTGSGSG